MVMLPKFGRFETCVLRRVDGSDQKTCGEGAGGIPHWSCQRGLIFLECRSQSTGSQDFLPRSTPHRNCPSRRSVANWATINSKVDSFCGDFTLAEKVAGSAVLQSLHGRDTTLALRSERKHGLYTEQFPVSAYVGSSKNLKDLKSTTPDTKRQSTNSLEDAGTGVPRS